MIDITKGTGGWGGGDMEVRTPCTAPPDRPLTGSPIRIDEARQQASFVCNTIISFSLSVRSEPTMQRANRQSLESLTESVVHVEYGVLSYIT